MPNNTVSDGVDNTCTKSFWMGCLVLLFFRPHLVLLSYKLICANFDQPGTGDSLAAAIYGQCKYYYMLNH